MASTLLTSLVSYWKLDEASGTRADSHGANSLTSNNSVSSTTGKIGNAADFVPASSQSLSRASNSDLQGGNFDFTFAGWAKFDDYAVSSGFPMAFAKTSGAIEYELFHSGTDIAWRVATVGSGNVLVARPRPTAGTWFFFECWHDATNDQIGLRLNNDTASTATALGGATVGTGTFRIGARGNNSLFLDGAIDEVGLWRRLLTSDERATLYNAGNGVTYPFSSSSLLLRRRRAA